jgi:hypothetical protein
VKIILSHKYTLFRLKQHTLSVPHVSIENDQNQALFYKTLKIQINCSVEINNKYSNIEVPTRCTCYRVTGIYIIHYSIEHIAFSAEYTLSTTVVILI